MPYKTFPRHVERGVHQECTVATNGMAKGFKHAPIPILGAPGAAVTMGRSKSAAAPCINQGYAPVRTQSTIRQSTVLEVTVINEPRQTTK